MAPSHAAFVPSGHAWPATFPSPLPSDAGVDPEDLFAGLDGRDIWFGGQFGHVRVYAVFDDDGGRWVQLAILAGHEGEEAGVEDALDVMTLKLGPREGVHAVFDALADSVRSRSERPVPNSW